MNCQLLSSFSDFIIMSHFYCARAMLLFSLIQLYFGDIAIAVALFFADVIADISVASTGNPLVIHALRRRFVNSQKRRPAFAVI